VAHGGQYTGCEKWKEGMMETIIVPTLQRGDAHPERSAFIQSANRRGAAHTYVPTQSVGTMMIRVGTMIMINTGIACICNLQSVIS
jgi:hypothetical protein